MPAAGYASTGRLLCIAMILKDQAIDTGFAGGHSEYTRNRHEDRDTIKSSNHLQAWKRGRRAAFFSSLGDVAKDLMKKCKDGGSDNHMMFKKFGSFARP